MGQITALAHGLTTILGGIETTLANKVFAIGLPVLGSQLGTALASNQPAVTAFQRFELAILNALAGFSTDSTTTQIQAAINQAIGALNLPGDPGSVIVTETGGTLSVVFANSFAPPAFSASLDGSFGLPGLGFKTTGTALTTLTYGLSATASVTSSDAFGFTAPGAALSVTLDVKSPTFAVDTTLGFINFGAKDAGSDVNGTFTLDTSGNATFQGGAALHVALTSDLGNAELPSITAQLDAGWSFTAANGAVNLGNQAGFGSLPTVKLSNVTYDFGSFLDKFLAPLMVSVNQAIDPIRPALDVLDADIPLLRDALGDHWHALDTAGTLDAQGHNTPDGKLSLLDFLDEPSGDPNATPAIVQLVDTLNVISSFASEFGGRTGSPNTPFDLGTFNVPGDIRNAAEQISQVIPQLVPGSAENLKAFESGLATLYPAIDPSDGETDGEDIADLLSNAQLSFPLLQNPVLAAGVLLGAKADLFTLVEPAQFIGVGSFNAAGGITGSQTIATFPIGVPPIGDVTPELSAALGATVGLTLGFDTTGLQDYKDTNFKDASLIANGLYIENPGSNDPILKLQAGLVLTVTAEAFGASVSADGGIDGSIGVSLKQSGKVYLSSLLAGLENDPLSVFNISGRLGGDVGITVSIGPFDASIRTPEFTLFSFGDTSTQGGGGNAPPRQTAVWSAPGEFGYLEVRSNWVFTIDPARAGAPDFYGDAAIQANTMVEDRGFGPANLTSITIGGGGGLQLDANVIRIDGRASNPDNAGLAYASENDGTLSVTGTAALELDADLANTGTITLGRAGDPSTTNLPSITVEELLHLTGGGTVVTYGAALWTAADLADTLNDGRAELWNADNLIEGAGVFQIQVLNEGTIRAKSADGIVLQGPLINRGTIEADLYSGNLLAAGSVVTLDTHSAVDNVHGVIRADGSSTVRIEDGTEIDGGQLVAALSIFSGGVAVVRPGVITAEGHVTLDGLSAGIDIGGEIDAADAVSPFGPVAGSGTLTLNGLIIGTPTTSVVSSAGDEDIVLHSTIFRGGVLSSTGTADMRVQAGATLDGSAGPGAVGLVGRLLADNTTLSTIGGIAALDASAEIELTGTTLTVGSATDDGVIFGEDSNGHQGTLFLDSYAVSAITGLDAGSNLSNAWTIMGTGALGKGKLVLSNTAAGTIEASGPDPFDLLDLDTGKNTIVNRGALASAGSAMLRIDSSVDNSGGQIAATGGGIVTLAITVSGGTLSTTGSGVITLGAGVTLDGGRAGALVLASGAQVHLAATQTFVGAIVNRTLLNLSDDLSSDPAKVLINGAVALSGGGSLMMRDLSGKQNDGTQSIVGLVAGDALDNVDGTIGGVGLLGNGTLDFSNEAHGTVSASGGTLRIVTRSGTIANTGTLTSAATGLLDLRSNVANAGGTVSADGGVTELDNDIVTGGSFASSAGGQVDADFATIDATQGTVTLLPGARVGVNAKQSIYQTSLTLKGDFANGGALFAETSAQVGAVSLIVSGSVSLHGGGEVDLADDTAGKAGNGDVFVGDPGSVPATYGHNTLDNVDNTIGGVGQLGGPSLAILNEAAGTVSAHGGTLTISTRSSNSVPSNGSLVNRGILQAAGGTLDLRADVDNRGGVVQAMNDGAGHSGTVLLDSAVISGGALASDAADAGSFLSAMSATLDGSTASVTLGAGSPLHVSPGGSITWKGGIVNLGTVVVQANSFAGRGAVITITGSVRLSGGGQIAMSDLSAAGDSIQGAGGKDVLDNVDNTISGFGRLGFGAMSLTNEARGTIAARSGTLSVAPGGTGSTWSNLGLMAAIGGTLDLAGTVSNAGGTIAARNDGAGHSGTTMLDGVTILGGTLAGDATDAASLFSTSASRQDTLDGTSNAVTLDAAAQLQVGPTATLTLKGAVNDQGVIAVLANSSAFYSVATLQLSGVVTLGGSGTVSLTDISGTKGTHTQVITGVSSADTLHNGVMISGVGQLGAGTLTLLNDAGGTVQAAGGSLFVSTGASTIVNHGRISAAQGGTLDLQSAVANDGGIIAADGGTVLIDGATIAGGTLGGNGTGVIAGNGGVIDGTAHAITIAANTTVGLLATVPNVYGRSLTLEGAIVNHGTLLVQGDDTGQADRSQLLISGAVTLSGGGQVSLGGLTARDTGADTLVSAAAAGGTLETVDDTIAGFGNVGVALTDDALGTVRAQGGVLHLGAVQGLGTLSVADHATLDLDGTVGAGLTLDFQPGGGHEAAVFAKPLAMNAAIADFAATDTISFSGNYRAVTRSFAGEVMSVTGDGALIGSLAFVGNYNAANVSVVDQGGMVTITTSVACFAAGTQIRTCWGEQPIEALAIGDMLLTAAGRRVPVRWIGRRSYAGRFFRANPRVHPIRLRAGSLGPGRPRRDLLVSAEHAVFLDGLLVPARCLVNGTTIVRAAALDRIDYVHVELLEHDVILAEGAPCETFVDDDSRGMFHNAAEFAALYPDAASDAVFCAPRVEDGGELEAIRRWLDRVGRRLGQEERVAGRSGQRMDAEPTYFP